MITLPTSLGFAVTYLQSNLLEVAVFWLFYRKRAGFKFKDVLLLVSLSNLITHPIVFFYFMSPREGATYIASILAAETFAIVAEALLHGSLAKPLSWAQVSAASVAANLFSWQLGPLVTHALWLSGRY